MVARSLERAFFYSLALFSNYSLWFGPRAGVYSFVGEILHIQLGSVRAGSLGGN
ncbi:hypothetical protein EDD73_10583 [Heliophilum fasciatum]|uniref:Uncharacterized protein n=1 Tax=Heliophilum fasciatum TaxID=35700 RepID=A0A4R2RV28_9FIRM|nr:hypothetical protein [Heliophilum fasciatum]TCP67188.1 hypothetical protein EDD73_10583 [Heliophilum fasciatum]